MAKSTNWPAFTAGAAFGALAMAGIFTYKKTLAPDANGVIHIERSINIGKPIEALFSSWLNLESIPRLIGVVRKVERFGAGSRWTASLDGREFEWDAQITQVIFNESIGWKSVNGPRHSGRISFSPLGDQTVLHVVMSYVPRMGLGAATGDNLEQWIDRGLREFKASVEDDSLRRESLPRTGTRGPEVVSQTRLVKEK